MKQLVFTCGFLLCVEGVMGQGTIQVGNSFSGPTGGVVFRAPIYNYEPFDGGCSISGQSPIGTPAGTTVYSGLLLQGTGFTFALFAGPQGASESALQLVTTTTFRTANGNALLAGLVNTVTVPINGLLPGQIATLQIRVWDNIGGTVTSWAQVLAVPQAQRGQSQRFDSGPLGGPNPDPTQTAIVPPQTIGWASFNIAVPAGCSVPEPSCLALAVLAAALVCIRRRLPG